MHPDRPSSRTVVEDRPVAIEGQQAVIQDVILQQSVPRLENHRRHIVAILNKLFAAIPLSDSAVFTRLVSLLNLENISEHGPSDIVGAI